MKKIFLFLFLIFLPFHTFANTFIKTKVWDYGVQYIDYDISSDIYDIRMMYEEDSGNLSDMMLNYNGITALNGVFFCPADYPECNGKDFTINEHFIEGREIATYDDTGERVVFGWNEAKEAFLYQTGKINPDRKWEIYEGFANFPLLLSAGKNGLEHYYDVGLVDKKMRSTKQARHFICSSQDKKHILFGRTDPMDLDILVTTLVWLWCYDALNLDAGLSSSFIYNGRQIVGPGRDVLDGVTIVRKDLDVKVLEQKVLQVSEKFRDIFLKKKDRDTAKIQLRKYISQVGDARVGIYEKNSVDIVDTEGNIIGYKIDITSLSTLKKVYILNSLQWHLQTLLKEL